MINIKLAANLKISRVVLGHWRLMDWKLTSQELLSHTLRVMELGVNTFDHADIYGDYSSEKEFGDAMSLQKSIRDRLKLVTKCGIKLMSGKYPERRLPHYDYSYEHITGSVENSLKNFRTDHIDILLLHRPAPFIDPEEVSRAFSHLHAAGKVLHFGVSNFNPRQYEMLNGNLDQKLVTNQVEISPSCLDHFDNGNIDFFVQEKIKPMAWSPLARGKLFNPGNEKESRIYAALKLVAAELNVTNIDTVIYCWLLQHPASIIPIAGTGRIDRLQHALDALNVKMSIEQWYLIYTASRGVNVP
jgi:predicted oxidoreductase